VGAVRAAFAANRRSADRLLHYGLGGAGMRGVIYATGLAVRGAVLAASICLMAPTTTSAQTNVSASSGFSAESPDALKHQLFKLLEAGAAEDSYSIRNRKIGASGGVTYWMRRRPGATPGLCVSDRIELAFDGLNDPSTISGVGAKRMYHFIMPPPSPDPPLRYVGGVDADAACAALHPETADTFLNAKDAWIATRGAWIFNLVQTGSNTGYPPFAIECAESSKAECKQRLEALTLQRLDWIGDCNGAPPIGPGDTCWLLGFGFDQWRIVVNRNLVPLRAIEQGPIFVTAERQPR